MTTIEKKSVDQKKVEKSSPLLGILIAVVIALALILSGLIFKYYDQKSKMTEMVNVLTEEKDSLSHELENMLLITQVFPSGTSKVAEKLLNCKNLACLSCAIPRLLISNNPRTKKNN